MSSERPHNISGSSCHQVEEEGKSIFYKTHSFFSFEVWVASASMSYFYSNQTERQWIYLPILINHLW